MKSSISTAVCLLLFCLPGFAGFDFDSYARENSGRGFLYQYNLNAFNARIALLQTVPSGSKVKIATFHFEFGDAVQELAANVCHAISRGVLVEFVVDSKSGDRVNHVDAFNKRDQRKNEELYQYMANCGAQVYIHNSIPDSEFVSVSLIGIPLPVQIPHVFPANQVRGGKVEIFDVLSRGKWLKRRLEKNLTDKGHRVDLVGFLNDIQSLGSALSRLSSDSNASIDVTSDSGSSQVDQRIRSFSAAFNKVIENPLIQRTTVDQFSTVVNAVKTAIYEDPQLNYVRQKIRAFNRLNHRKLFYVESGGRACAFIGGRNLGDHYLLTNGESYHDGDVFTCGSKTTDSIFADLTDSFDELKEPSEDLMSGQGVVSRPRRLQINPASATPLTQMEKVSLRAVDFPNGSRLRAFSHPHILMSGWNPQTDETAEFLIDAIEREQKEVYIETAYAEFNLGLRTALEGALRRGVKVNIVTNGYFISDGFSGLIRLEMAGWNDDMRKSYPNLFSVKFATAQSNHMIHFKGAGFRCQRYGARRVRVYLVGSHNFHPRSGYSDKEHMLQWQESTSTSCPAPNHDLIAFRNAYYNHESHAGQLSSYQTNDLNVSSFYMELLEVSRLRGRRHQKNVIIARGYMLGVDEHRQQSCETVAT